METDMTPPGTHTFTIGDVHGRANLLETMLSHIADRSSLEGFDYRIVFLGNVIDKGPDSHRALEIVMNTVSTVTGSRLILGNHDAIPLQIIDEDDPEKAKMRLAFWISKQHGWSTLLAYGFDPMDVTVESFRERFDPGHVAFLRSADHYIETENHILVHAGLRPGIPLAEQTPKDLMWIKEPFLSDRQSSGKMVVHGHTVTESGFPEVYPNRVGIDTGACGSGHLTAAHIVGSEITEFLWTTGPYPAVETVRPKQSD
jgi:serine/threonine protein phosphatase 1